MNRVHKKSYWGGVITGAAAVFLIYVIIRIIFPLLIALIIVALLYGVWRFRRGGNETSSRI